MTDDSIDDAIRKITERTLSRSLEEFMIDMNFRLIAALLEEDPESKDILLKEILVLMSGKDPKVLEELITEMRASRGTKL